MLNNGYIYAHFCETKESSEELLFPPELEVEQLDPLRNAPNAIQQNQNQTTTADDVKRRHSNMCRI